MALIRPLNLLLLALVWFTLRAALLEPALAALGQPSGLNLGQYALLGFSVLLITAGGYAVNALYDRQADQINAPHKNPLLSGFPERRAWWIYGAVTVLGIALPGVLSLWKFVLLHLTAALSLWLYSALLKGLPFAGNALVALLCAVSVFETAWLDLPLLYAAAGGGNFEAQYALFLLLLYTGFAFLTTLLRELVKDLEDLPGDRRAGYRTLAVLWGIPGVQSLCLGITAVLTMLLFWQCRALWQLGRTASSVFVALLLIAPLFYFLYKLRRARTASDFGILGRLLKIYMLLGLLFLWWDWAA